MGAILDTSSVWTAPVLVVEATAGARDDVCGAFTRAGLSVRRMVAGDAELALSAEAARGVILVDQRVTGSFELISLLRSRAPTAAIVALLDGPVLSDTVQALKHGADECVFHPIDEQDLVDRACRALLAASERSQPLSGIIGEAPEMEELRHRIRMVAKARVSCVLITGETGTGKDLVARAIHDASSDAAGPFINITCTALPDSLLESELFGHEPGAFTGATRLKRGLFEEASGGTAFLDEIGDMAPSLQAKLLRFMESRRFRRVGGTEDIHVDLRLMAATHRDLGQAVARGSFRKDLFYRLQVVRLELPALRRRCSDVDLLAKHFVRHFSRELSKHVSGIELAALELLRRHSWPGNVRELKHVIESSVLMCPGTRLRVEDLRFAPLRPAYTFDLPPGGLVIDEVERDLLLQALQRSGWDPSKAGKLLGLAREQVRERMAKLGVTAPGDGLAA